MSYAGKSRCISRTRPKDGDPSGITGVMGTKNNPGQFDCYANAEPDEPIFVLRASDPTAPLVLTFWRAMKLEMRERGQSNISDDKLDEARRCSLAMEVWCEERAPGMPTHALKAFRAVLRKPKGPRVPR